MCFCHRITEIIKEQSQHRVNYRYRRNALNLPRHLAELTPLSDWRSFVWSLLNTSELPISVTFIGQLKVGRVADRSAAISTLQFHISLQLELHPAFPDDQDVCFRILHFCWTCGRGGITDQTSWAQDQRPESSVGHRHTQAVCMSVIRQTNWNMKKYKEMQKKSTDPQNEANWPNQKTD